MMVVLLLSCYFAVVVVEGCEYCITYFAILNSFLLIVSNKNQINHCSVSPNWILSWIPLFKRSPHILHGYLSLPFNIYPPFLFSWKFICNIKQKKAKRTWPFCHQRWTKNGDPSTLWPAGSWLCAGKNSRSSVSESKSKFYLGREKEPRIRIPGGRIRMWAPPLLQRL